MFEARVQPIEDVYSSLLTPVGNVITHPCVVGLKIAILQSPAKKKAI